MLGDRPHDDLSVTIVEAAFKILFPNAASRIEGIASIANVINNIRGNDRAKKALIRRLEDAADQILDKLHLLETKEFSRLDEAEKTMAVGAVNYELHFIANGIDADSLYDLTSPESLRKRISNSVSQRWKKSDLSTEATTYGRMYMAEACQFVVALVHDLPTAQSKVLWETYILTKRMSESIDRAIASIVLPQFRQGTPMLTSTFEAGYLSDIMTDNKYVELFGLRLAPELRRQPVDIAYIKLRSMWTARVRESRGSAHLLANTPARNDPKVDEALGAAAEAARASIRGSRIVITGTAGSGKTTITQWIATRLADGSLPPVLGAWSGCIPFVIRLRSILPRNSPLTEADLIGGSAHRYPFIPGEWIKSTFSAGKAVLMFDGLDELKESDRTAALQWIEKLVSTYPTAHVIITTRPDNLDALWFNDGGYTHLRLLPMNHAEVNELISRWFKARLLYADQEHRKRYSQSMQALLRDAKNRPAIRDLTETPLLCAMLCALYAHQLSGNAPSTRTELYERVTTALAYGRDEDQEIRLPVIETFPLKDRMQLLQALARHLVETSRLTLFVDRTPSSDAMVDSATVGPTALEIVEARLAEMPTARLSARQALTHLLDRSVVFRKVNDQEAHFVHRSLQEFLAGRDYGQSSSVENLIEYVPQAAWHRVIVFAAGSSSVYQASALVNAILDRAANDRSDGRTLLILAAETASAAVRIDEGTTRRVRGALAAILPPTTLEEASLVSAVGEDVLDWLRGRPVVEPETMRACVHAAARVGGPSALALIRDYAAGERSQLVVEEFLANWDRFDEDEYATKVLAMLALEGCTVAVINPRQLAALPSLSALRSLKIMASVPIEDIRPVPDLVRLRELDCGSAAPLQSLNGIERLVAVRRLNLADQHTLNRLHELSELPDLEELYLANCSSLVDVSALASLRRLRSLVLDGCTNVRDFSPLNGLTEMRSLSLNNCRIDNIDFCRSMPKLRTLRANTATEIGVGTALRSCPQLERLELRLARSGPPLDLSRCTRLRFLSLSGSVSENHLRTIGDAADLREFRVSDVHGLGWLSILQGFKRLQKLSMVDCSFGNSAPLRGVTSLEELNLSGSLIEDLDFAGQLVKLRHATFDRCQALYDITGLTDLRELQTVSLLEGVPITSNAVSSLERRSKSRFKLVVYHQTYSDEDFYGPQG